jgi:ketosteroid isomerase-like protein
MMKTVCMITLICSTSVLASACGLAGTRGNADIVSTVRLKFAAFNRHDASAIQGIYADDAILHSPDYPELTGNAPIADTYRRLFDAIPDAQDTIQSLGSSGDKVYVEFALIGHWQGAANQALNVRIMSIYTVKDGRISVDSTYYDRQRP